MSLDDKSKTKEFQVNEAESKVIEEKSPSIGQVVDKIREDSTKNPEQYLDEVHVPGGGE